MLFSRRHLGSLTQPALSALFLFSFVYCVRHLIFSALQPSPPWFPYSTSIVCLVSLQLCVLCQAPRYSVLFSRRHLGSLTQPALSALFKGQLCVLCQAPRYSVLFSRRHLGSLTQPALSALFLVSFVYCVRHLDIQCSSAVATLVPLLNQHCLPCFSSALCTVSGTSIFSALQPSPPWFPYSTSIVCLVSSQLCVLCQAPRYSVLFSRRHLGSLTQPALSALFKSALCTVSGTSIFSALQPSPPWFPYSTSIVCLV